MDQSGYNVAVYTSREYHGESFGLESKQESKPTGGLSWSQWRPHVPDSSHDAHWNHKLVNINKVGDNIGEWINVDFSGERIY